MKRAAGGRQGLCGRVPSSRRTNVTSKPRARRTKGWRGNHVVCAAEEAREADAAEGKQGCRSSGRRGRSQRSGRGRGRGTLEDGGRCGQT